MAEATNLSRGAFFILCAQLKLVLSNSTHCKMLLVDDRLEALDHSMMLLGFRRPAELMTTPLNDSVIHELLLLD